MTQFATNPIITPSTGDDTLGQSLMMGHTQFDSRLAGIVGSFKLAIRATYSSDKIFAYHNVEHHIGEVWNAARELARLCAENGIEVHLPVLEAAVWGHDCLPGSDPELLNQKSPEHLAAFYSRGLLKKLGAPEWFIEAVGEAIEATNSEVTPISIEAKIMRAADLRNLAGPFENFLANTNLLHQERQNLTGRKIDFGEFVRGSIRFLSRYLAEYVQLTPKATDQSGRSAWHQATMKNLLQAFNQTLPPGANSIVVADLSNGKSKIEEPIGGGISMHILVRERNEMRTALSLPSKPELLRLALPGSPALAPIPDAACDRVHLFRPDTATLTEAARIVKEVGSIVIDVPHQQTLFGVADTARKLNLHVIGSYGLERGNVLILSKRPQALVA